MTQVQIMSLLGKRWATLDEASKAIYEKKATDGQVIQKKKRADYFNSNSSSSSSAESKLIKNSVTTASAVNKETKKSNKRKATDATAVVKGAKGTIVETTAVPITEIPSTTTTVENMVC